MKKEEKLLPGVSVRVGKNGQLYYRSSLTYKKKHISLGSFRTNSLAHKAYKLGRMLLEDSSITLNSYEPSCVLPFEKWVCLINFRDNAIYLSNPIYMGQKMITYYLDYWHALKFDLDDMFYYTSHKIMKRGNHYFVADYGMQVNLLSRYGIQSYAVPNRDYIFLNGDSQDFRRENLKIINPYHGVRKETKNGQPLYVVRIHITSQLIVGRYKDEITAAIAYNKAIDQLIKNGVQKKFLTNYLDGLSPKTYADIYQQITISKRIKEYRPILTHNQ